VFHETEVEHNYITRSYIYIYIYIYIYTSIYVVFRGLKILTSHQTPIIVGNEVLIRSAVLQIRHY